MRRIAANKLFIDGILYRNEVAEIIGEEVCRHYPFTHETERTEYYTEYIVHTRKG